MIRKNKRLQKYKPPPKVGPTWDQLRTRVQEMAKKSGEWAGCPMPIEGTRLVIHPSYPFADALGVPVNPRPSVFACRDSDVREDVAERNSFRSYKDGRGITIWKNGDKFHYSYSSTQNTGPMLLTTLSAARAWDYKAELKAMDTLKTMVNEWQYQAYVMTGSFLESSTKSGVAYLFRRLRPTVAMTGNPTRSGRDIGMRILCTLCMHPIGYYDGSWAGALVPTDDVIAHLLSMRSDEHDYWRQSNQHPAWAPESGL